MVLSKITRYGEELVLGECETMGKLMEARLGLLIYPRATIDCKQCETFVCGKYVLLYFNDHALQAGLDFLFSTFISELFHIISRTSFHNICH